MSHLQKKPPKWMDKVIELYCRSDLLEDLQGDIHEYYNRNIKKGKLKADFIFLLDVIKFCRLYTIQKPKFLGRMTFFYLFKNYFKTSVRSITRNKLFSSINIVGLSIAMSIGILMIVYLTSIFNYDDFHEKKERIYKVLTNWQDLEDGDEKYFSSTSYFIGKKMEEEFSGIEDVVMLNRQSNHDFKVADKTLNMRGIYASTDFFNVLSFDLIQGDPATALEEPFSVVLTEKASRKLFKDENPIGKILLSGKKQYKVTGLMANPPKNTHIANFEMLESYAGRVQKEGKRKYFKNWGNIWADHVYVLLEEGVDPLSVQTQLDKISKQQNEDRAGFDVFFELERIDKLVPSKPRSNTIGTSIYWGDVLKLIILTMIILATATFNYTNLSIARSLRRAREVGVRKVVGASRSQVFSQFILEAVTIALIALIMGVAIFFLIKPEFARQVIGNSRAELNFNLTSLSYCLLFAIILGIVAGFLPSMILSKLKAIPVLKDINKARYFKGLTLRRVLIVFQFVVSMSLIIAATISYRQYIFSLNYELGYRTDNILNVSLRNARGKADLFKNELAKITEVQKVSESLLIPSTQSMYMNTVYYQGDSVDVFHNNVDEMYMDLHDMELIAGEHFFETQTDSIGYLIIDERLVSELNFAESEDAIGKLVDFRKNKPSRIIGVAKNYQYTDLRNDVAPTVLVYNHDKQVNHLNLLINTENMIDLMDKLENAWKKVDPVHPFRAFFFEDQIERVYAEYKTMFNLFSFLALLSVLISTMGLLGIVVFTTETRIKEISVRKVLGASEGNLIKLLSKSFVMMLVIATAISLPLSYYLFDRLILTDFRERISIGFLELAPGIGIITFIALITITWQTLKASKTNPAEMLRNE